VVKIDDVVAAPSGTAAGGGRLYISGTTINYHDDVGGDVDLENMVSGPASSTSGAMVRWDGTSGGLVKDSGVSIAESGTYIQTPTTTASTPTFSFTSTATDGVYFPASASVAVATSGTDRLTVSPTAITVPGAVQADAGVEVGGASGTSYSLSAANFISDVQTASGTFEWSNASGSILATSGLDLSFPNNMVFTEGAETLTVGHNGTTYDFNSDGTTPKDLVLSVGGTDIVDFNSTDVNVTGDLVTPGRVSASSSSSGTSDYSYSSSNINRGFKYSTGNASSIGLASSPAITFNENHNISLCSTTVFSAQGSGIMYLQKNSSLPTGVVADALTLYQDTVDIQGLGLLTTVPLRSMSDAGKERAQITLTTSVSASTSTDTDGLTWTSVDENGVVGTTLGRLATDDDCFVGMTATAEWASDSTGYRRLSIMRRTTGPVYTRLNGVTTTAVNGDITSQTVYFFGSISAANDELTVQVEQTTSGALSVDLSIGLIRYETNVAV
jgi:hypothetical protein